MSYLLISQSNGETNIHGVIQQLNSWSIYTAMIAHYPPLQLDNKQRMYYLMQAEKLLKQDIGTIGSAIPVNNTSNEFIHYLINLN